MSAANWFEGGRSSSRQLMQIVGLAGAAYVVFSIDNVPTLATRGPTMPWFVSDEDCERPSYRREGWRPEWEESLVLCLLALDNGQIPYAVSPTIDEEKLRQARREAEERVHMGEPPARLNSAWFQTADGGARVSHYFDRRVEEFKVTPELRKRLHETRGSTRWRAHKRALRDAAPWIVAIWALIWIFTAVTGRIARDFAGVPTGEDFRNDA